MRAALCRLRDEVNVRIFIVKLYSDGSNVADLDDAAAAGPRTAIEINDTDVVADIETALAQRDALCKLGDGRFVVVLEDGEPPDAS